LILARKRLGHLHYPVNPVLRLILVLFIGGLTIPVHAESSAPSVTPESAKNQEVYAFQHRVLPKWTHRSDGAFYEALQKGVPQQLVATATKMVGENFAKHIAVENTTQPEGVLITFEKPSEVPHCYFAFITKTADGFRYITLEKAMDITEDGTKSVICEWTADGAHRNYGFGKFTDSKTFLENASKRLKLGAEAGEKSPAADMK
jgi:hypothetical protein